MILHYIPKDQLRTHWDFIKHGLDLVRAKGHTEWIVEDVYCDCYENRSMVFLAITDNKPCGFVVLQPIGNTLHIWAAYSQSHDILSEGLKQITDIATQMNAKNITFSSYRNGWEKIAPTLGFKPYTWRFEC